jgi:hypothetical protein
VLHLDKYYYVAVAQLEEQFPSKKLVTGSSPVSNTICMKQPFCKYCKLTFDNLNTNQRANHSRWCEKNPKRNYYICTLTKARAAKTNYENQFTKAKREGREVPVSPNKGKVGSFAGKTHSFETKQKMKEKALASSHRRLKKGTLLYKGVLLDSSWELELAKRLDELNVEWLRPDPIKWLDQTGTSHNYFPDFYIPEWDLYLDPKNPQAVRVQQHKLNMLLTQYPNIRILTTLEECKNFKI